MILCVCAYTGVRNCQNVNHKRNDKLNAGTAFDISKYDYNSRTGAKQIDTLLLLLGSFVLSDATNVSLCAWKLCAFVGLRTCVCAYACMSICVYVEFIFFPSLSLESETVIAVGFQSWLDDSVFCRVCAANMWAHLLSIHTTLRDKHCFGWLNHRCR